LGRRFGADSVARISHQPDDAIEALFGRQPELTVPESDRMGFTHDGTADALIARALERSS
jgi:hypothetical protein